MLNNSRTSVPDSRIFFDILNSPRSSSICNPASKSVRGTCQLLAHPKPRRLPRPRPRSNRNRRHPPAPQLRRPQRFNHRHSHAGRIDGQIAN